MRKSLTILTMALIAIMILTAAAGAGLEKKKKEPAKAKGEAIQDSQKAGSSTSSAGSPDQTAKKDNKQNAPQKYDVFIDQNKDGIDDRVKKQPVISNNKKVQTKSKVPVAPPKTDPEKK